MPAVAGDLVYIGSCAGNFYALNKANGAVRWSYDIRKDGNQQSFHGNPLLQNDLILIGTDKSCAPDGVGYVYAFDKSTGAVRWKYRTTSASTDIIKVGPDVYFGNFQDNWTALKLSSGSLTWKFLTGQSNPDCTLPKSPVADDSHLYVAALDGTIYAFDAQSGRIIWKRALPSPPSTTLLLQDKYLFVGTSDNHIYRLKSESGATDGEITVVAKPVGRPVLSGDSLLLFLEERSEHASYLVSVSSDVSGVRWMRKSSPEWASERPYVSNGLIVAGNCRGELASFRASDGAPQWQTSLKGCIRSIGGADNNLYVGVQEGTVYALRY